ncbi:conserved hypothetical protein [Neospora caninum Liverpool]|uniref:Uncharacterized protein n=1 Tax=Neospora caninum (strain Liverpool) TaxID=572307 RepID=F0VKW0_NEOCL|nr:conserved hypothetical protein [Neospora caninum Liverpool]CBZ54711.1 conserved hypothetical protein [Neospora caninum Liverpool]CEL69427.1 TPA: hypothetical protein BN1204_051380 [Neospora caninum Liverpool]|eukprot:XP_003884741.1 conserved hypothetical protein [Neospora caninum Liverpool]
MANTKRCGKTPAADPEAHVHPKPQAESSRGSKRTREGRNASHRNKSVSALASPSTSSLPASSMSSPSSSPATLSSALASWSSSRSPATAPASSCGPRRSPRLARGGVSPSSSLPARTWAAASVSHSPQASLSALQAKAVDCPVASQAGPLASQGIRRASEDAAEREEEKKGAAKEEGRGDKEGEENGQGEKRCERAERGQQAGKRLRLRTSVSSPENAASIASLGNPGRQPGSSGCAETAEPEKTETRKGKDTEDGGSGRTVTSRGGRRRNRPRVLCGQAEEEPEAGAAKGTDGEEGEGDAEKQTVKEEAAVEQGADEHPDREKDIGREEKTGEDATEKDCAKPDASRGPEKNKTYPASKLLAAAKKFVRPFGHTSHLKTETEGTAASGVPLSSLVPSYTSSSGPEPSLAAASLSSSLSTSLSTFSPTSLSTSSLSSSSLATSLSSSPSSSSPPSSSPSSSVLTFSPSSASASTPFLSNSSRSSSSPCTSSLSSSLLASSAASSFSLAGSLCPHAGASARRDQELAATFSASAPSTLQRPACSLLRNLPSLQKRLLATKQQLLEKLQAKTKSTPALPSSPSSSSARGVSASPPEASSVAGSSVERSSTSPLSRSSAADPPRCPAGHRRGMSSGPGASPPKTQAPPEKREKKGAGQEGICKRENVVVIAIDDAESDEEDRTSRTIQTVAHADLVQSSSSSCSRAVTISEKRPADQCVSFSASSAWAPERKEEPPSFSPSGTDASSPRSFSESSPHRTSPRLSSARSRPRASQLPHASRQLPCVVSVSSASSPLNSPVSCPSSPLADFSAGSSPAPSPLSCVCLEREPRIRFSLKKLPAASPHVVSAEYHRRREALQREAEEGEIIELSPPCRKISSAPCLLPSSRPPHGASAAGRAASRRHQTEDVASWRECEEREKERAAGRDGEGRAAQSSRRSGEKEPQMHATRERTRTGGRLGPYFSGADKSHSPHFLLPPQVLQGRSRDAQDSDTVREARGSRRFHYEAPASAAVPPSCASFHLPQTVHVSLDGSSQVVFPPLFQPQQQILQSHAPPPGLPSPGASTLSSSPALFGSPFSSAWRHTVAGRASPLSPRSLSCVPVSGRDSAAPMGDPLRREDRGESDAPSAKKTPDLQNGEPSGEGQAETRGGGERLPRSAVTKLHRGDCRAPHGRPVCEAERTRSGCSEVSCMPRGVRSVPTKTGEKGEVCPYRAVSEDRGPNLSRVLTSLYATFAAEATGSGVDLSVLFLAFDEAFIRPHRRARRQNALASSGTSSLSTCSVSSDASSLSPARRSLPLSGSEKGSHRGRRAARRRARTLARRRERKREGRESRDMPAREGKRHRTSCSPELEVEMRCASPRGRKRDSASVQRREDRGKERRKRPREQRMRGWSDTSTSEGRDERDGVVHVERGRPASAAGGGESLKREREAQRRVSRSPGTKIEEHESSGETGPSPRLTQGERTNGRDQEAGDQPRVGTREKGRHAAREESKTKRDKGEGTNRGKGRFVGEDAGDRDAGQEEGETEGAQETAAGAAEPACGENVREGMNENEAERREKTETGDESRENEAALHCHFGGDAYLLGFQMETTTRKGGMSFIDKLRALKRFRGKAMLGK